MEFLTFIVVLFMAYLLWRIVDQLPDVTFRLSEIQRDLAEIRRRVDAESRGEPASAPAKLAPSTPEPEPVAEAEEAEQE
jgi:hypothetical protein